MSARAHAKRAVLRQRQAVLRASVSDPRQVARALATERALDVAQALLAPLDEPDLAPMQQQRAAVAILDATSPLATASVEVQLPADEAGVQQLGWAQLQQLAAALLDEPEYQAVPALPEAEE